MVDAELPQFLVVLDAQPIEQHVFQFGSGALRELWNEASRLGLQLAITDIQLREVQAHVAEQVRQVKRLARALEAGAGKRSVRSNQDESRDGGVPLPNLLKHNIVKAALAGLDQAADAVMKSLEDLMDSGTLHIIESGHVVASRIFSKYFANEPPFSTGRKKDEFPDAFAIEAIRDRAAQLSGTQMVVVSNDNDWLEALGDDDSIVFRQTIAEALQHIRKLDDAGRLFAGVLVDQQTHLNELIEERFPELNFSLAGDWSGDVDGVSVVGSAIKNVTVISFRDRAAVIEFETNIHFRAEASYPADDWTEWYPTHMQANIDKHEIMVGTAVVRLDKDLAKVEEVFDVGFDDDAVEVSLDDATEIHRRRSTMAE